MDLTAEGIVQRAREQGIFLYLEEGRLGFKQKKGADFTDELKRVISDNKAAITAQLEGKARSESLCREVLRRDNPGDVVVTSFAQQRFWFIDRLGQGSAEYSAPVALDVVGDFSVAAAREGLLRIVRRHEVLRTTYEEGPDGALQRIHRNVDFDIAYQDFATLSGEEQGRRLADLIQADARKPFDLARDLMLRVHFVSLGRQDGQARGVLIFNVHHIATDGWSLEVLFREFAAQYCAAVEGKPDPLPPLALQYGDFAQWQREWLKGERLDAQLDYWTGQLAGLPVVHGLALDKTRPAHKRFEGRRVVGHLRADVALSLRTLAQGFGLTPFMLLHGALALVLSAHSESRDIVVGTPVANRRQKALESLIGVFVNTLVLRVGTGHETLAEYFEHVRQVHLDAQTHQDMPFEQLVERLHVARSTAHTPLFQIFFSTNSDFGFDGGAVQSGPILPGVELNPRGVSVFASRFDLEIVINMTRDGLDLIWTYDEALFLEVNINRLNRHLSQLLTTLSNQCDIILMRADFPLSRLSILTPEEQIRLTRTLNATVHPYDSSRRIHEFFQLQASRTPDATALVYEGASVTYGELDRQSNRLARYLRDSGVEAGDRVGICLERSSLMVVGLLGILKAGAAYVPLDPGYPQSRLDLVMEDAGLSHLVSDREALSVLEVSASVTTICLDGPEWRGSEDGALAASPERDGDGLAYVIYTSGSTGKPKGVKVSHRNVANFFAGLSRALGHEGEPWTWLAVTSISFDISVLELLWTLSKGDRVVIQPDRPVALSPMREMAFSLFYFAAQEASTQGNKYALLLEGAKFADRHGLAGVWVPERHFASFGDPFPNPSVAAAAVAAVTERVRIRSGSVVLPLHDPIRVAEEWSMVDNLSNGRVELSLASGWHPDDFVLAPEHYANRHETLRTHMATLKRLWEGHSISRRNGLGRIVDIKVHPLPVQATLPLWITAAGSPETFRYAGSIGANLLTHLLGQRVEELEEKIRIYREARESAGLDGAEGRVALMLHTYVSEEGNVREVVEAPLRSYLRHSVHLLTPLAEEAGIDVEQDLEGVLDVAFERYYQSSGLFGTPEQCLARVEELQSAGVDEIASLIDFGIDTQTALAGLPGLGKLQRLTQRKAAQGRMLAKRTEREWSPHVLMAAHGVTHLQCTPSFVDHWAGDEEGQKGLEQLRMLLVGGEAISAQLAARLVSAVGGEVYNMYGPTETTVWSSVGRLDGGPVRLGGPLANQRFYVMDSRLQLVPEGVAGELCIGGEGVTAGYHGRDALTAERFVADPFGAAGGRLYRTGDLVRWTGEGQLEFLGRLDDQVKVNGFRIELGEIEHHINQVAGVHSSVVTVVKGENGTARLVGCVKRDGSRDGGGAKERLQERIRHALREALPAYMCPVAYVEVDVWPVTPNGKIDRNALQFAALVAGDKVHEAPSTEIEIAIARIWANLLNLEQAKIGTKDNFFELGGHSLLLVAMIEAINKAFEVDIHMQDAFMQLTVESLSRTITAMKSVKQAAEFVARTDAALIEEVEF